MAATLLALTMELRQQVISESMHIELKGEKDRVRTPLSRICKLLQTDIHELHKSWLPGATTDILVRDSGSMRAFKALRCQYEQLVKSIGRSCEAIRTVWLS